MTTLVEPEYPLPRPLEPDRRFSMGLTVDVARVLEQHGYPKVVAGTDLLELQQALFRFLYEHERGGSR